MAHDNESDVVLIVNADTDIAREAAQDILDSGARVVVTARTTASLTRILLRRSRDRMFAIAADLDDPRQRSRFCERVLTEYGPPTWVVDGRTGEAVALTRRGLLRPAA